MAALTISAPSAPRRQVRTSAFVGSAPSRVRTTPPSSTTPSEAVPPTVVRRSAEPVRLTRRGRRLARTVVVVIALLITLVLALAGRVPALEAGDSPAVPATATVVVQPGDTLWSVAKAVAPGADPRETIERILTLNNLTGPAAKSVAPGQQLVVPAAG